MDHKPHNPRPNPNAWQDALERLRLRLTTQKETPTPAPAATFFFHAHPQGEPCVVACSRLG